MYNRNLVKSYGLEDHHISPQSVLYKNGYKKKESKDRKIVNDLSNRAFLTKKANLRASNALPSKGSADSCGRSSRFSPSCRTV